MTSNLLKLLATILALTIPGTPWMLSLAMEPIFLASYSPTTTVLSYAILPNLFQAALVLLSQPI